MASLIIGVSGRKRSGKDTFASRLVSDHGFTRVAFADPLKAVARDLDPVIAYDRHRDHSADEILPVTLLDVLGPEEDWETAKEIPEVRRILQALGVAVREHVETDVWVNAALRRADEIPGPVVITDVRFPNEVQAVRRRGGSIVRVTRPGLPEGDLHPSETALDALVADYPVLNNSTIAQLHAHADTVARDVFAGH